MSIVVQPRCRRGTHTCNQLCFATTFPHLHLYTGVCNTASQISLQSTAQLVLTLLQELSEELAGYRHYEKFIRLIERLHTRTHCAPTRSPSAVSPRRMTAYVAKVLWEELPEPNKGMRWYGTLNWRCTPSLVSAQPQAS